ncbi:MAG: hypothetical protein JSV56_03490 [Methanomassiliicoccales archaeon]|nr:MAG: hypothetical protein JSV56_03490 [Methanomassiliicoccales archaeon]
MADEIKCSCGCELNPKIFYVDEFQIRGSECPKCGKTYLNGEDVARYAENRKGINVSDRVVC